MIRVAGLQADLVWEDPEANRRLLGPRVRAEVAHGADLVVLPEMWPTGFSMAPEAVGEPPDGPSERWMAETAADTGAWLCGSFAQRDPATGAALNVCVLVGPDGDRVRYAKIHPFAYGGEAEKYEAGEEAHTLAVRGVRVTPLVCYDLRFAELFQPLAERTDVFVVVANWPTPRAKHWRVLLVARAMDAQCYVLGVNRVGEGGGLEYRGDSMLVAPNGDVLDAAPPSEEAVVAGEVDPGRVSALRADLPFLQDRRPDLYERLRRST